MSLSDEPVLELVNADIFQDEELILDNVTFKMQKGEFVYLIGRTGCGKSSLLHSQNNESFAGFTRSNSPELSQELGKRLREKQMKNRF